MCICLALGPYIAPPNNHSYPTPAATLTRDSVLDMAQLRQYYLDGWGITRQSGDTAVVISDAFLPPNVWNRFMTYLSHVILDVHHYEVFSPGEVAMPIDRHVAAVCAVGRSISAGAVDKWTVVGEWSGALTDVGHTPPAPYT